MEVPFADKSRHFDQGANADVILHIGIEDESSRIDLNSRKRAGPERPHVKSFFLHSFVLLDSTYFEALLRRWGTAANTAGGGQQALGSHQFRLEITERVSEDDLEAMELLLRHWYNSGEELQQSEHPATTVIRMLRLADRFGLPSYCVKGIFEALTLEPLEVGPMAELLALPPSILQPQRSALESMVRDCIRSLLDGSDPARAMLRLVEVLELNTAGCYAPLVKVSDHWDGEGDGAACIPRSP